MVGYVICTKKNIRTLYKLKTTILKSALDVKGANEYPIKADQFTNMSSGQGSHGSTRPLHWIKL